MPHIQAFSTVARKSRHLRKDGRFREVGFVAGAAGFGEGGRAGRVGEGSGNGVGQGGGVVDGDQQAGAVGIDQLGGTADGGGDDGAAGGPRLDHHVAERLLAGRADEQVGSGQQTRDVGAPAGQMDAVGDTFGAGEGFQGSAFRALAGDDGVGVGQAGQGADQDVERLVGMQAAKAEQDARIGGDAEIGAGSGALHVGDEIGQVMGAGGGPALLGDPADQGAGVGDQVVAAVEVPQVVIAAEAAAQHPVAAGGEAGGAAHPGDGDAGRETAQRGTQARAGEQVERIAEAELGRGEARFVQPGCAVGLAADHRQHGVAGAVLGDAEALVEQLGAAFAGAGHDVRHFQGRGGKRHGRQRIACLSADRRAPRYPA